MNLPRFSVQNPVAVNLLMAAILVGGLLAALTINREFFPTISPDQILVIVPYPGATPEEVEKGVARPLERELMDVQEVDEIRSQIYEGLCLTYIVLEEGANGEEIINDVRGEVDIARADFPDAVEDPRIELLRPFIPVIAIVLHGNVSERQLHDAGLRVRDEVLAFPGVARAILTGTRPLELRAEVDPEKLEQYGLTFEEVGRAVAQQNVDVPGGRLKTRKGEIGVRTVGESDVETELAQYIVKADPSGRVLRLSDLAVVREAFAEDPQRGFYKGEPAVQILIFKGPEADAISLANRVKEYARKLQGSLAGGAIKVTTSTDLSRFIAQRLDLMLRNARWGMLLVAITLAIFLDLRVAFWVAFGVPVSVLGTFLVMAATGVTFNLISLFGLIIVLGLIVDDAIVIGENVFRRVRMGESLTEAAVNGTTEVALPVVAAVATTLVAFLPLGFIKGVIGQLMVVLPTVMCAALLVSLVEGFVILPAHLAHTRDRRLLDRFHWTHRLKLRVNRFKARLFEQWLPAIYVATLRFALRWRYPVFAALVASGLLAAGAVRGGIVPFVFVQEADAESMSITIEMAAGTSEERTTEVIKYVSHVLENMPEVRHVFAVVGTAVSERGELVAAEPATLGQIAVELIPADQRELQGLRTSQQVAAEVQRQCGDLPGLKRLSVVTHSGGPAGPEIEIRVKGHDLDVLRRAVAYVRNEVASYRGVTEVEDDLKLGKLEARLRLRPAARALGLTTLSAASLVRNALYGFEAQEIQREREELKVRVILPQELRRSFSDLGRILVPTPRGDRVPLEEVVSISTGRGYATLAHVNGERSVTVSAEVDDTQGNAAEITASLQKRLADIGRRFPGVSVEFVGQNKETAEAFSSLKIGFPAALLGIYAIIAVVFRSYFQPIIVLVAVPFGLVGAVVGHLVMGYPYTMLSLIGSVALSGIAVNDAIVLVDFINRARRSGTPLWDAIVESGRVRLRPVLLTTLTTISGMAPLMLERSFQAQFLIPMAVAIVFGLMFATFLTLLAVPVLYLIQEDIRGALRWLWYGDWHGKVSGSEQPGFAPH